MPIGPRQLQQFVAVAEELSFRRAAQRLHMAQPPLTQAIQRLERSLGLELFARSHGGVQLSAAGQAFLAEARRALAQIDRAVAAARSAAAGTRGRLRLAFVPSAGLGIVPQIVAAFRNLHPEVELELRGETTTMQLESLRTDRIDAGILVPPLRDAGDVRITPLAIERLVAALPAGHPLAVRERIHLAQLADEPFVLFPLVQGPAFLNAILVACQRAGFFPRVVAESPQLQMLLTLIACGMGVSLVPAAMRAVRFENVHYAELTDRPQPRYQLATASLAQAASPVLSHFLAVAQKAAATAAASSRS